MLATIRFYQRRISPNLAPMCRYQPTCSAYAYQAIERYGPLKGLWLAVTRLVRCTPLGRGGWDPIP